MSYHAHVMSYRSHMTGLGKTVQVVSVLHYLYTYRNIKGPSLIIAPLSTLSHWSREFEGWTNMNASM